jgi:anti-sigma factor RsiW
LTSRDRADLVAYLDGELPETQARRVAERLADDPNALRELSALEQTWGLLDELERPSPSSDLTTRTLVVAQGAQGQIPDLGRSTALRHGLGIAGVLCLALGFGFLAYLMARGLRPESPSARLVRDLSMAERLDDYRAVRTFGFLQRLDETGLFNAYEP